MTTSIGAELVALGGTVAQASEDVHGRCGTHGSTGGYREADRDGIHARMGSGRAVHLR